MIVADARPEPTIRDAPLVRNPAAAIDSLHRFPNGTDPALNQRQFVAAFLVTQLEVDQC